MNQKDIKQSDEPICSDMRLNESIARPVISKTLASEFTATKHEIKWVMLELPPINLWNLPN